MSQYITLPNGSPVSLATYANAWRKLKTMAPSKQVSGFSHFPERADFILRAMRDGLHDRINTRGGIILKEGRKSLVCVAARINNPRAILERWDLQQLPKRVAARLVHRLRESA